MDKPWEKWIPGVLNKQQIKQLCEKGLIENLSDEAIDESSFDLSLSNEGYRMTEGSVKPSSLKSYEWIIKKQGLANPMQPDQDNTYLLKAKKTYVFKLREKLSKNLVEVGIHGQATAKSSVGRVDVLARLIVSGMNRYEGFDPDGFLKAEYPGVMYLEITPITFDVKVKEGISLTQLRLFYGNPESVEIKGKEIKRTVVHGPGKEAGSLSVDLTSVTISGLEVTAFYGEGGDNLAPVPLWKQEDNTTRPRPEDYWRFLHDMGSKQRIKIEQRRFYLLRSKERISVPPGIAVYCRASDETIGEMRIHYAGFAHPWFGWEREDDQPGTPLIFEVRGHDVDVSLADGERMANLQFFRMSEDCREKPLEVAYGTQTLQLSKFFGKWPEKLKQLENGKVELTGGKRK